MGWFLYLLLAIIVNVIAYFLTPKPKKNKPPEVEESEDPTAEAGKPIPVVFGTLSKRELNVLWFGDKHYVEKKVKA